MNLRKTILDTLIDTLRHELPDVVFIASDKLCWSPQTRTITYIREPESLENIWGLLHETAHAQLNHHTYTSDVELLKLEAAAWDEAIKLGERTGHTIDLDHTQDCLDTYRDWLHQRSTCPRCGIVSFEASTGHYRCLNCRKTWTVSASRLCRPYRLGTGHIKDRSGHASQAVFQIKISK